jgi:predicted enzyme related to lactoylglutathione lyase
MLATGTKDCFIGFAQARAIVPSPTCATFEVENIGHAVRGLQQKGVRFEGEIIEIPGMVKLAAFFGPDGYKMMLQERTGPA